MSTITEPNGWRSSDGTGDEAGSDTGEEPLIPGDHGSTGEELKINTSILGRGRRRSAGLAGRSGDSAFSDDPCAGAGVAAWNKEQEKDMDMEGCNEEEQENMGHVSPPSESGSQEEVSSPPKECRGDPVSFAFGWRGLEAQRNADDIGKGSEEGEEDSSSVTGAGRLKRRVSLGIDYRGDLSSCQHCTCPHAWCSYSLVPDETWQETWAVR